jgi:hypothetical protein
MGTQWQASNVSGGSGLAGMPGAGTNSGGLAFTARASLVGVSLEARAVAGRDGSACRADAGRLSCGCRVAAGRLFCACRALAGRTGSGLAMEACSGQSGTWLMVDAEAAAAAAERAAEAAAAAAAAATAAMETEALEPAVGMATRVASGGCGAWLRAARDKQGVQRVVQACRSWRYDVLSVLVPAVSSGRQQTACNWRWHSGPPCCKPQQTLGGCTVAGRIAAAAVCTLLHHTQQQSHACKVPWQQPA